MKKLIREYSIADLKNDILKSGASINGDQMDNNGSLSPDFINILGDIFKSGIIKGCEVTITGGNDKYHKDNSPNSLHTKGNAIDMTISNACRPKLKNYINTELKTKYPQISYLDEYEHPSPKSTGPHLHIQYGGTPLKSGDESTGVYSGYSGNSGDSTLTKSSDENDKYKNILLGYLNKSNPNTQTESKVGETNEEMSLPVYDNQGELKNNIYKYKNTRINNKFYSPYDGIIDSINIGNNNEYTIVVKHKYIENNKNDKLISKISGFSTINNKLSSGSHISEGDLIGYMDNGDILIWELNDQYGKKVSISDYLENKNKDKDKDKDKDYTPNLDKAPGLLKFALNYLNPFAIPFGAAKMAKKIGYQKESTQEQNVLTEEIQRIKSLMK